MTTVSPKVVKLEDVTSRDVFEFRGLIIQFQLTQQPGWLRGRTRVANVEVSPMQWTVAFAQTAEGTSIEVPVKRIGNDFYCVQSYANKPSVFRVTKDRLDELSGNALGNAVRLRSCADKEEHVALKFQQLKAQIR